MDNVTLNYSSKKCVPPLPFLVYLYFLLYSDKLLLLNIWTKYHWTKLKQVNNSQRIHLTPRFYNKLNLNYIKCTAMHDPSINKLKIKQQVPSTVYFIILKLGCSWEMLITPSPPPLCHNYFLGILLSQESWHKAL